MALTDRNYCLTNNKAMLSLVAPRGIFLLFLESLQINFFVFYNYPSATKKDLTHFLMKQS